MRIVQAEANRGGKALPWTDPEAFARRALALSREDIAVLPPGTGPVFFDRGLVDAACALEFATGRPESAAYQGQHLFDRRVFLVPPWPEHLQPSADRQGDLLAATAEYARLCTTYERLGFSIEILARQSVECRADRVLKILGLNRAIG